MDEEKKMDRWPVYRCEPVEKDSSGAKAIMIHRREPLREVEALPKGFATKVLLGYDFSRDDDVFGFICEYGPVMCPYAGAMERAIAAIRQPTVYGDLLGSIVMERTGGGAVRGPMELTLNGLIGRRPSLASDRFIDCDVEADARNLYYKGVQESAETGYLIEHGRGFARRFEDALIDSERFRVSALRDVARLSKGEGIELADPDCLVSLEEARMMLYTFQVSSLVLDSHSYFIHGGREKLGRSAQLVKYAGELIPEGDRADRDSEACRAGCAMALTEAGIRQIERTFALFIQGRPNLIKAFRAVIPNSIVLNDGPDHGSRWMPGGILSEMERRAADDRLTEARNKFSDDAEALDLLEMTPQWEAWEHALEDSAIFIEACLTDGWGDGGHRLISTPILRVEGYGDGGPVFGKRTGRMTLQRALAEQVVEQLEVARAEAKKPGRKSRESTGAWKVCRVCGSLYMYRSTSRKAVPAGEGKPSRNNLPTAPTCSEACRMIEARS